MTKPALLLAALLALPAAAQVPADEANERARITAERSRVEAEFEAGHKACYGRFAVNDCIDAAKSRRREALADLRRQEVSLNDAERRRRAAERLAEIEARKQEQAQQEQEPVRSKAPEEPKAAREAQPVEKAEKTQRVPEAPKARTAKAAREPKVREQPDSEETLRRHNQRVAEAGEHKAKVEQRAAQAKKAVRPLPVPP